MSEPNDLADIRAHYQRLLRKSAEREAATQRAAGPGARALIHVGAPPV